jgi:hypothetical protein
MHNKMNEIYYKNNVIKHELYHRATLYNKLLKKYSPIYDQVILKLDVDKRKKQFKNLGNRLRKELER